MPEQVIVLHSSDNVGTAVSDLEVGQRIETQGRSLNVEEPVPFGHKLALVQIATGEVILKYGEPIGRATTDIQAGGCVHTHNVESQRGRGDLRDNT